MNPRLAAAIARADERDRRNAQRLARSDPAPPALNALDQERRVAGRETDAPHGIGKSGQAVCAFRVDGEPVAWARSGRNVAKRQTFTPARQRAAMRHVAMCAGLSMRGRVPVDGAVVLALTVWLTIPKSWPKWRQSAAAAGNLRPTGRPDASNLAKLVEDALNGLVWADDAQVVDLVVRKFYTTGEPGTEVTVRWA